MKRKRWDLFPVVVVLVWGLLPGLLWAAIYKWTDDQGVVHFTDDLLKIPPQYRPKVKQQPSVSSPRKEVFQGEGPNGFRNATWGMSKAQVRQTETSQFVGEEESGGIEMIGYHGKVAGFPCFITYVFAENQLVRGVYSLQPKHTNKNDYIHDYETLKTLLTQKYGSPDQDKVLWRNDLYRDKRQHWGLAVSLGHVLFLAQWTRGETRITLALRGENFDMDFRIEYASLRLASLEEQAKRKKALQQF